MIRVADYIAKIPAPPSLRHIFPVTDSGTLLDALE